MIEDLLAIFDNKAEFIHLEVAGIMSATEWVGDQANCDSILTGFYQISPQYQ